MRCAPATSFPLIGKHRGAKRPETEYFGPFASAGAVNDTLNALLKATSAQLPRQHLRLAHPALPAIPDQALLGALRRPGRRRDLRPDRRGGARVPLGQVRRGADPPAGRDARRQRQARLRARGRPARPAQGHGAHPGAAGHQHRGGRGRRRRRRASGGRAGLHPGVFYRAGRNYRNRAYYPAHTKDATSGEILAAFLAQFYAERVPARLVLLVEPVPEQALLAEATGRARRAQGRAAGAASRRPTAAGRDRGTNARQALARRLADTASQEALLEQLADRFDLPETPARVEVYDNSHIQGSNAIGAFIVAGPEGFDKRSYRTFNIKGGELAAGDDYAMMREVLQRRFARLIEEDPERTSESWPGLVVIDGGAGSSPLPRPPWRARTGRPAVARWPRSRAQRLARSSSSCPAASRWRWTRAIRSSTLSSGCATRRIGSRSRPIAGNGRGTSGARCSIRSRGSAPSASARCSTISARPAACPRLAMLDLERVPGIDRAVAKAIHDFFHDGA